MGITSRWRRREPDDAPSPTPGAPPSTPPGTSPSPDPSPDSTPDLLESSPRRRRRVRDLGPIALVRAAHPGQAVLTSFGVGLAAALSGRPAREVALVLVTVLVGQSVLGWHNDLVDRVRDARHDRTGKPVAQGRLDPGTVWFALACGVLLVVPLAVANGITAGSAYLLSLAVGLLGNVVLRQGVFSWVPWAASYALFPAFLSYAGWGGQALGDPPSTAMTVLAALLGIGVHVMRAVWGLKADHEDGWTYLPLRLSLALGATRTLTLAVLWSVVVVVAMCWVGSTVGLAR